MTHPSHRSRPPGALRLGIALIAALTALAAAASEGVPMATLRVEDGSGSVRIEMPAKVLEYVLQHAKSSVDVGKVNGKEVRFPREELLKALGDKSVRGQEVLFLTVREGGKEVRLYLRTDLRKVPAKAKKPERMVFSVKDGEGKEEVRVGVALSMVKAWAEDYGKGEDGSGEDDFGPFVRACLAEAGKVGAGPILTIRGKDGTISFELE